MRTADGAVSRAARAFAWGGALLFFGSLSFFLYTYAVTFGERGAAAGPAGLGVPAAGAAALDVALFTLFALHHSIFARERVRSRIARIVPAGLERASYVWVASLMLVGLCLLWQPVPGVAWQASGAWRWTALGAQAFGIWLTLRSAAALDILELAGVRQLFRPDRPFVFTTSGPYGWVRHPIYTGWLLLVFGVPTMTMTRLVFATVSSLYLLVAIPLEERSIRRAAGPAYEGYAEQVPWKLLPWVF